jgi:hypothetical protein
MSAPPVSRRDLPTSAQPGRHGVVRGVIGFALLTIAIVWAPVLPRWTGYVAFIAFVGMLIVGDADLGIAAAGLVWLAIGRTLLAGAAVGATLTASRA